MTTYITAGIYLDARHDSPAPEITGQVLDGMTMTGHVGIGQGHLWSADPARLRELAAKANEIADELEQAIASKEKVA